MILCHLKINQMTMSFNITGDEERRYERCDERLRRECCDEGRRCEYCSDCDERRRCECCSWVWGG